MSTITKISSSKCFKGFQNTYTHFSKTTQCIMKFAIYLPPQSENQKVPVLYHLNGLTGNEENFVRKAGAQQYAAKHGICIVCPDTSPRDVIPGEANDPDLGAGASFYVDATEAPWNKHYQMYSYVSSELIDLITENFPVIPGRQSISGHSMGGHGALVCALRNPLKYLSVSVYAAIANSRLTPKCRRAFLTYLGADEQKWLQYDATELIKIYNGPAIEIFLDQGSEDPYYTNKYLLPENLIAAAKTSKNVRAFLKLREGYDHGHYFVSTVVEEHMNYHAKFLKTDLKL